MANKLLMLNAESLPPRACQGLPRGSETRNLDRLPGRASFAGGPWTFPVTGFFIQGARGMTTSPQPPLTSPLAKCINCHGRKKVSALSALELVPLAETFCSASRRAPPVRTYQSLCACHSTAATGTLPRRETARGVRSCFSSTAPKMRRTALCLAASRRLAEPITRRRVFPSQRMANSHQYTSLAPPLRFRRGKQHRAMVAGATTAAMGNVGVG